MAVTCLPGFPTELPRRPISTGRHVLVSHHLEHLIDSFCCHVSAILDKKVGTLLVNPPTCWFSIDDRPNLRVFFFSVHSFNCLLYTVYTVVHCPSFLTAYPHLLCSILDTNSSWGFTIPRHVQSLIPSGHLVI